MTPRTRGASSAELREQPAFIRHPLHPALHAAGRRAIAALRDFADELDSAGLRPMATSALHEAHEVSAMLVAALRRLERANDNNRQSVIVQGSSEDGPEDSAVLATNSARSRATFSSSPGC